MTVTYNEINNSLKINDNASSNQLLIKFVLFLNLFNAVIQLISKPIEQFRALDYFWLLAGVFSCYGLYLFFFKKSTVEHIQIEDIVHLQSKTFFGSQRFALKLKNGKTRDLPFLKDKTERTETLALLSK